MASSLSEAPFTENDDRLATLKQQFLASLDHEIRTPLSGIMGMIDLLLETPLDSEQKEYVNTTRHCAIELLSVLNATLEYSALSAGGLKLDQSEFNLVAVLDSAVDEFALRAREKGLSLVWRPRWPLPEVVVGDPTRLRQLLGCLLDNAIKFTSSGGVEVILEAVAANRCAEVVIRVRDTGIGIAPDKIREIFDSFRQLNGGLARTHSGLGLGLAIAQKLVELMSGEIRVTSEPGVGSCFVLHVPFRLPQDAAQAGADGTASRGYRVLVVEDNLIARKVVTHVLTRNGYQVDCAEGGLQAIQAAQRTPYHLILMDLQMPEMDGLEATLAIRGLPGYASTPVVAFTANSFGDTRALCREHGMQGFLTKPVDASELLGTLRQFLP